MEGREDARQGADGNQRDDTGHAPPRRPTPFCAGLDPLGEIGGSMNVFHVLVQQVM